MNKKLVLFLLPMVILGFQSTASAASKKCYSMNASWYDAPEFGTLANYSKQVNHGKKSNNECRAAALRDFNRLVGSRGDRDRRNELCWFAAKNGDWINWYSPESVDVKIFWDRDRKNTPRNPKYLQTIRLNCKP